MNVNKEINKLQKKIAKEVEDMVLQNLDEINIQAYEYYTPILMEMQRIVDEVYSTIRMDLETYKQYSNRFIEVSKPFAERDDYMLKITEEVVRRNKIILNEALNKLVACLSRMPITEQRIKLEFKKCQNNAVAKMTRFLNINYKEINQEFNGIINYCYDSLIDFGKSSRVIDDIEIVFEIEETLNEDIDLVKTDDIKFIIDFAIDNGYKKVRQNGSHGIYKHSNGQMVVIPVHNTIDVYLGMAIQKQIIQRSK